MKEIYVSQITNHFAEEIIDEFYLKKIELEYSKRTNTPYLYLRLEDKTGSINGRIWEHNIEESYLSLAGNVVKVYGELINNETKLELVCYKIEAIAETSKKEFIKGLSDTEIQKYTTTLKKQIALIKNSSLNELVNTIINLHLKRIVELPVRLTNAGAYNGALLVQMVSVTSMSIQLMRSHKLYGYYSRIHFDEDLLIAGSLLFCIGYINLYTPFPEATKITEYSILSLDNLSIQIIESKVNELKSYLPVETKNLLYHMIQCAYKKENIKPKIREAAILYHSVKLYETVCMQDFFLEESKLTHGSFYVPEINNYLYITEKMIKGGSERNDTV